MQAARVASCGWRAQSGCVGVWSGVQAGAWLRAGTACVSPASLLAPAPALRAHGPHACSGSSGSSSGSNTCRRGVHTSAACSRDNMYRANPRWRTPTPGSRLWARRMRRGLRPGGKPFGDPSEWGDNKPARVKRHTWFGLAEKMPRPQRPRVVPWHEALGSTQAPVRLPPRVDPYDPVVVAMGTPVRRCALSQVLAPRALLLRFTRAAEVDEAGELTGRVSSAARRGLWWGAAASCAGGDMRPCRQVC